MQALVSNLIHDPDVYWLEDVQSLWSGYGSIQRYFSPLLGRSLIVKAVQPDTKVQHPRGWSGEIGHQRKLRSYQVERAFYEHYASDCDSACRVPVFLAARAIDDGFVLCLEDLDVSGFGARITQAAPAHVHQVVIWLAHFHARFLAVDAPDLWSTGCYWHLGTRQEEWDSMPDNALKSAAGQLDEALNQARFKTLVHGDAKLANFCFDERQARVAAVDFQYVGQGVGVRDLAYFLGGCMDDSALEQDAERWLDVYFDVLCSQLPERVDAQALEAEWRALYPIAWADFHRFLAGWMPTHWKINGYMQRLTDTVLSAM